LKEKNVTMSEPAIESETQQRPKKSSCCFEIRSDFKFIDGKYIKVKIA
jgi:hypothetical protein